MENCKFAYRQRGEVSLRCKKVDGKMNFCAHQYFCRNTGRWEATRQAGACPLQTAMQTGAEHGAPIQPAGNETESW